MSNLRESVDVYIKRVKELADHVRGNEQATKLSLIGPFFSMLGYDLTDPRECIPELKADFGKDRSTKPIDWAFRHSGAFALFVEAKETSVKLDVPTNGWATLACESATLCQSTLSTTNGAQD